MKKSKLIQLLTGSFIVLFACVVMSCSKSTDQVQDDEMLGSADTEVTSPSSEEANLGAGSSGRGR